LGGWGTGSPSAQTGAADEEFLFPDGYGAFQSVNGVTASVEGGGAVRGADRDENAGVADFEAAEAVHDRKVMDCEASVNVRGDFAQLGVGHGLVGFVLEIEGALAFEIVAHEAVEDHGGAIFEGLEVEQNFAWLDGFAHQKNDVAVDGGLLATTYGREEGNLVTWCERGAPLCILLVHGGGDRRAKF